MTTGEEVLVGFRFNPEGWEEDFTIQITSFRELEDYGVIFNPNIHII